MIIITLKKVTYIPVMQKFLEQGGELWFTLFSGILDMQKAVEKSDNLPETEPLLEWQNHPARSRPVVGALLFILIGAASVLTIAFTGLFLMGLLALLILLGAFATFLFPVKYKITADEVCVSTLFGNQKRVLKNYRRVVKERRGALISPFSRPHRLDSIRGFYIRKEEKPDELWDVLERVINKDKQPG